MANFLNPSRKERRAKMIHIATDSTADMPPDWVDAYDLAIIPVNIHFGEQTFLQGVDLDYEGFYRMVEQSGQVPKTSQPSPGQFIEFYRGIANPGDTVISMHVTSKLSGTYSSAAMAARELAGQIEVIPFDSQAGSAGLGYMCREASELARAGTPVDGILARLEEIRAGMEILLTLNSMEYARMSGRVKALQAALASMLNVKPIIQLEQGDLLMRERVRTRRRAIDRVVAIMNDHFKDQPVNAAVVHARDPDAGEQLMARVPNHLNCVNLIMTDLSTGIAANLGPGTVGVVAYPVNAER